jgi:hypothetical protein
LACWEDKAVPLSPTLSIIVWWDTMSWHLV